MEDETKTIDSTLEIEEKSEPKRKRGRPKKEAPTLDATKIEESITEKPKRKPYKKRGVDNAESISALAKQIYGIHQIIAATTGLQELVIGEEEAQLLSASVVRVANEYGLSLSGKTGAALQLIGAAAFIYVPRVLAINKRIVAGTEAPVNNEK